MDHGHLKKTHHHETPPDDSIVWDSYIEIQACKYDHPITINHHKFTIQSSSNHPTISPSNHPTISPNISPNISPKISTFNLTFPWNPSEAAASSGLQQFDRSWSDQVSGWVRSVELSGAGRWWLVNDLVNDLVNGELVVKFIRGASWMMEDDDSHHCHSFCSKPLAIIMVSDGR